MCSFRTDDNTLIFIDGPSVRKVKAAHRAGSRSPTDPTPPAGGLEVRSWSGVISPTSDHAQPLSASSISSAGGHTSGTEPSPASLAGVKSPPLPKHESPRTPGTGVSFAPHEIDDLRLMRYFHTSAWEDFTHVGGKVDNHELRYLWKEVVPDLALDHTFLLHALLSVSAIHIAMPSEESKPSTREFAEKSAMISLFAPKAIDSEAMIARAEHHHGLAMRMMGPVLAESMSAATLPPLFLTACLLAQYGFARSCVVKPTPETLPELCHVLTLMRGTGTIVRAGVAHLNTTPVRPWLLPMPKVPDAPLGADATAYLSRLDQLLAERFPDYVPHDLSAYLPFNALANGPDDGASAENDARAYQACIRHTQHGFLLAREQGDSALVSVPWSVSLPATVLRGIQSREPLALGLACAYAIMLHGLKHQIWIQNWGQRIVDACEDALAERLLRGENVDLGLLDWPRSMVRSARKAEDLMEEL